MVVIKAVSKQRITEIGYLDHSWYLPVADTLDSPNRRFLVHYIGKESIIKSVIIEWFS